MSTLHLESSYLHANIAQGGAGMRLQMSSVASAVSSVFSENVATYRGGGVLVRPVMAPSVCIYRTIWNWADHGLYRQIIESCFRVISCDIL